MADAPIVSIDAIEARARKAACDGKPRDSHEMNWNAAALPHWLREFDRMQHTIKHMAAGEQRVDVAQVAV